MASQRCPIWTHWGSHFWALTFFWFPTILFRGLIQLFRVWSKRRDLRSGLRNLRVLLLNLVLMSRPDFIDSLPFFWVALSIRLILSGGVIEGSSWFHVSLLIKGIWRFWRGCIVILGNVPGSFSKKFNNVVEETKIFSIGVWRKTDIHLHKRKQKYRPICTKSDRQWSLCPEPAPLPAAQKCQGLQAFGDRWGGPGRSTCADGGWGAGIGRERSICVVYWGQGVHPRGGPWQYIAMPQTPSTRGIQVA